MAEEVFVLAIVPACKGGVVGRLRVAAVDPLVEGSLHSAGQYPKGAEYQLGCRPKRPGIHLLLAR